MTQANAESAKHGSTASIEVIARIIDPVAFDEWGRRYAYKANEKSEDDRKSFADAMGEVQLAAARGKAAKILAALSAKPLVQSGVGLIETADLDYDASGDNVCAGAPVQSVEVGLVEEAKFLLERLADFEGELGGSTTHVAREYAGHVHPSVSRLRRLIDDVAPLASERIERGARVIFDQLASKGEHWEDGVWEEARAEVKAYCRALSEQIMGGANV